QLAPPPAAPWTSEIPSESHGREPTVQELARKTRVTRGDVAGVVRALLSGGSANVDDPTSAELPPWSASIERMLPEPGGRPRCGVWCIGGACGSLDRVAELVAAAWHEPAGRAAMAWTLLCELAIARGESVDSTRAARDSLDASAVLNAPERTGLDGGTSVVDVLHAWGRGRFDRSPDAGTLAARLA